MLIPESLWLPTVKDLAAQFAPVQFVSRNDLSLANVLVISTMLTQVPNDQVFYCYHVHGLAIGGAAQTVVDFNLNVLDEAGNLIYPIYDSTTNPPLPTAQHSADRQGQWILMPFQSVSIAATFNLGAAANRVIVHAAGVLIPRGNWQRGG